MRLADARALVPDLVTTPGEPQADHRLIETLANWCDRYTPWVAIDPLGGAIAEEGIEACSAGGFGGDAGLLLDVTGCAHLFGQGEAGERALLADLTERLARHDLTCRAAMADTAGAAWALARFAERQADLFCPPRGHRQALAALPVEGLRLDAPIVETFLKLGLRRIGDLYPLPRAPLGAPLRRPAAHPPRPGAWARSSSPSSRAARRLPSARASPSSSRSAGPRTSPPRPAACSPPSAGSSSRRASARAGSRSRSIASTARSIAPAIGTSRPNRDNPKLMKLFEEKLGELDPGFGVELMILAAPEVEAWERHAGRAARRRRDRGVAGRGRHHRSRRPPGVAPGPGKRRAPAAARQPSARARADDRRRGQARIGRRLEARGGDEGCAADAAAAAARAGRCHGPRARRSALGLPLAPACPSHRARRGARARGRRMVAAPSRRQPAAGQHRAAAIATTTASRTTTAAASGCSATGLTGWRPTAGRRPAGSSMDSAHEKEPSHHPRAR